MVIGRRLSSPASSPSTSSWSPGAASSARFNTRAIATYGVIAADGALARHSCRCGEMKNGWLGSFAGLQ